MSPARQTNGPIAIKIVYPTPKQVVYDTSTFLMGAVCNAEPGSRLMLGQQQIPLSPQGFFAWKIPLHSGINPLKLNLLPAGSAGPPLAQEILSIYQAPPLSVLPALPLAIHQKTLQPAEDVWLSPGDSLEVSLSASVDADVSVSFPGLHEAPIPLQPMPSSAGEFVDNREPVFKHLHQTTERIPTRGHYRASIPASTLSPQWKAAENIPMILHMQHDANRWQKTLPGRLSLLTMPRWAEVVEDRTITRTAPDPGDRLTPQRKGTLVAVDGLRQGWARIRLNRDETFFIAQKALRFLPAVPSHERTLVNIQAHPLNAQSAEISLKLSGDNPSPILLDTAPGLNRLQARLYGVKAQSDSIQYASGQYPSGQSPPDNGIIRQIHWRPVGEDTLEVWIDLTRPLAGYDYALRDGQWHLSVHTLPQTPAETRVLIDPGHGGAETGSTGMNGLPEKNLNLTVSKLLRDALRAKGFQVRLTREADVDLSLPARSAQAASNTDIVLSIHHNALPDGRDPLAETGACCFYYHGFAKALAERLQAGLIHPITPGKFTIPAYGPDNGVLHESLHMARIHQATAVLMEIGFFTNPTEFERLIQPAFQQEVANHIADALVAYLQSG